MFKDKGVREVTRIQKDLQPYTSMTTEYEILDRLHGAELELMLANRHIITSNDRYQFSVGHLMSARTKIQFATAVANSVTEQSAFANMQEPAMRATAIADFLIATFESSSDDMEKADRIASTKGFLADAIQKSDLVDSLQIAWPDSSLFTPAFVQGSIRALDIISSNILVEAATTLRSQLLPNNFKQRLNKHFTPILAEISAKQKGIERARSGSAHKVFTPEMLQDIQHDVMKCIDLLSKVSLWIVAPRLFDSYFELKKPLDELRGPVKPFNPQSLGGTAVSPVVERVRPSVPVKPFNPDTLVTPASDTSIQTDSKSTPSTTQKKEFDPTILEITHGESRPFDPTTLRPKE